MDASPQVPTGLSLGARISLLVAVLLLVPAAYLLVAPLERPTSQGPPFGCGTAVSPPHTQFARSVCGDMNRRNLLRSGTLGVAAVLFGTPGRRQAVEASASGPAVQPSAVPAASPAAEPGGGTAAEPGGGTAAEPVAELGAGPVAEPGVEPLVDRPSRPPETAGSPGQSG